MMTNQQHNYNHDDLGKPMPGRNMHGTKRYRFKAIAIAAGQTLTYDFNAGTGVIK